MTPPLIVRDLRVEFPRPEDPTVIAVDGIAFSVDRGELVALVGESGCGKSLTALSLLGLLPGSARLGPDTSITFQGEELAGLDEAAYRPFRGARMAMVFQDPTASLNPVMRIGSQIGEALTAHRSLPPAKVRERAIALLTEVGIADPARRVDAWPHQLSGGMQQRVMLAIALAGEPELLIADEPTTALDVTVQAQILELLDTLRTTRGMAVLLITHDLGIVAGRADRVLVMYAGRIVESAPTRDLFRAPRHPYTRGLLRSLPRLEAGTERLMPIQGTVPSPEQWPSGCRFHPRCPLRIARCAEAAPSLEPGASRHHVACWVTGEGRHA
ncbi:MAG TPA: ABC transporter ATP-binding protein [Gemmatimonadales bacterium]|nr:ABC transporter ATP-binding protein [Gemmatimonadales bacterium]